MTNVAIPGLTDINLQIESPECASITGPSGSGKTRLLRALADLEPATGTVCLDNLTCSHWSGPDWRRQVALLTTENYWWHDTFCAHFQHIPDAAQLARLNLRADILQQKVHLGSSGERQRLALLRLLQYQPKVLLLDEPTANLDQRNKDLVETLILDYLHTAQACALWTSHDTAQIKRITDRHLVITNGTLVPEDRP